MKKNTTKQLILMLLTALIVISCSGGKNPSGGSPTEPASPKSISGYFIDAPVEGLTYSSGGLTGTTNSDGLFTCNEGSSVSFYLGETLIGESLCKKVITPINLIFGQINEDKKQSILNNTLVNTDTAKFKNLLSLIQSLNTGSGSTILIEPDVSSALSSLFPFGIDLSNINVQSKIIQVELITGKTLTYKSNENSLNHFIETMETPIVADMNLELLEDNVASLDLSFIIDEEVKKNGTFTLTPDDALLSTYLCENNVCSITPKRDFHGVLTYSYSVNYNGKNSSTKRITINVLPVNDAPTTGLNNQTFSTDEDVSVSIPVIEASDVDGDVLSYEFKTIPSHGFVFKNGSNYFYTPNLDFNGQDSFVYSITDGNLSTDVQITINVLPVNDAPSISSLNSLINVKIDGRIPLNLNFSDVDGDNLTLSQLNSLSHGEVICNSSDCSYEAKSLGTDVLRVRVSDGILSNEVQITVNVLDGLRVSPIVSITEPTTNNTYYYALNTEVEESSVILLSTTAVHSRTKLSFSSNRDDNPLIFSGAGSAVSMNLRYEYDVSEMNQSAYKSSDEALINSGATNQVVLFKNKIDTLGFLRVRVVDTITDEQSEWKRFKVALIAPPVAQEISIVSLFDDKKNLLNMNQFFSNSSTLSTIKKIELSVFHSDFNDELKLFINDVEVNVGSNQQLNKTDKVEIKVSYNYKINGKLFEVKSINSFGQESNKGVVNFTYKQNPFNQAKVLFNMMVQNTKIMNDAIKDSNPFKGETCSFLENGKVNSYELMNDLMVQGNSPIEFAFDKDGNGNLFVIMIKRGEGFKTIITPKDENGNLIIGNGDDSVVYNNYYVVGESPNSINVNYSYKEFSSSSEPYSTSIVVYSGQDALESVIYNSMAQKAKSLFYRRVVESLGLDRNYRFEMKIVFSDSDLNPVRKTQKAELENTEGLYLDGYILSNKHLTLGTLCDTPNLGYNILDIDAAFEEYNPSFPLYQESQIIVNERISYSFRFNGSISILRGDDYIATMYSIKHSFYMVNKDFVGTNFMMFANKNQLDTAFAELNYDFFRTSGYSFSFATKNEIGSPNYYRAGINELVYNNDVFSHENVKYHLTDLVNRDYVQKIDIPQFETEDETSFLLN